MGAYPFIINTAAASLDRSLFSRFGRFPKVVSGLFDFLRMPDKRGAVFYMSVSGGFGQVYDVMFVILARLFQMRIYLRHCSFAYLDSAFFLTRILSLLSGSSAMHITQSRGMSSLLQSIYNVQKTMPISNAVLYADDIVDVNSRDKLKTLGFLGNISFEKGVFDFLDLMERLKLHNSGIKAIIAGPFQDDKTELLVRARLRNLPDVTYLGPVYGEEKERFLSGIDVLVFPTRYKNETEAKVNHEAMRHGIPVIAYGRGCIPEIVTPDCGLVIAPDNSFSPLAFEKIVIWLKSPDLFRFACLSSVNRFKQIFHENNSRWKKLLKEITG